MMSTSLATRLAAVALAARTTCAMLLLPANASFDGPLPRLVDWEQGLDAQRIVATAAKGPDSDRGPARNLLVRGAAERASAGNKSTRTPSPIAVCSSFLEPSIQSDQLSRFATLARVPADPFFAETERLCTLAGFPLAGNRPSFAGSWASTPPPNKMDMLVLNGLSDFVRKQQEAGTWKQLTWDKFAKPDDGNSAGDLVKHIASQPKPVPVAGRRRILDFGCGSGQDLAATRRAFGDVAKEDALCLDVFKVEHADVTPIPLDASSDSAYRKSLEQALVGNEGSVHVVFSFVTFHHILSAMRTDALSFINRVLAPGGVFLIADWDNSPTYGVPSREIYYDLVHFLPGVFFSHNLPQDPAILHMATEYLPYPSWANIIVNSGLVYDEPRSILESRNGQRMSPMELAGSRSATNRDFYASFIRPAERR